MPRCTDSLLLLSLNDKSVKLWKIAERASRNVAFHNVEMGRFGGHAPVRSLRVPPLIRGERSIVATPRRIYSAAHAYHINALSTCADGLHFLSADDLRVNLWNLDHAQLAFTLVDVKPPSLEELTEVVTAAEFHPTHGNIFAYATSRGALRLGDTRAAALCDTPAASFTAPSPRGAEDYFGDIVAAHSDIDFSKNGTLLATRDYLTVKIWDLAMPRAPLTVLPVHDHLKKRLQYLYDNDYIFDRFQVSGGVQKKCNREQSTCVQVPHCGSKDTQQH